MDAQARERRRQDLLLAGELLRGQIDVQFDRVAPTADRIWAGVTLALWARRRLDDLPGGPAAGLFGAGLLGSAGLGLFALRRRRSFRLALLAWRVWRTLRRG